jgi:hypothetical protein
VRYLIRTRIDTPRSSRAEAARGFGHFLDERGRNNSFLSPAVFRFSNSHGAASTARFPHRGGSCARLNRSELR